MVRQGKLKPPPLSLTIFPALALFLLRTFSTKTTWPPIAPPRWPHSSLLRRMWIAQVGTVDTLAEILAIGNTTGATDIAVDSAQKVQFRDAAIYINSSVDGQLDIVADTEIQIAATTVDLNGAISDCEVLRHFRCDRCSNGYFPRHLWRHRRRRYY
jgi:hypothetical protein